jgi:hypothetical protein
MPLREAVGKPIFSDIARIRTKNGNFHHFSCILSQLAFSYPTTQQVRFWPVESESQRSSMVLDLDAGHRVTQEHLEWVRQHWVNGGHLFQGNSKFRLAMQAFDNCSFVLNAGLALIQLWGTLEALFSPGQTEVTFRTSANVAIFLEPPGAVRHSLQKKVATLYNARSAAAHGREKNVEDALVETYAVTRRVLLTIIEQNHVPSKEELEAELFGNREMADPVRRALLTAPWDDEPEDERQAVQEAREELARGETIPDADL